MYRERERERDGHSCRLARLRPEVFPWPWPRIKRLKQVPQNHRKTIGKTIGKPQKLLFTIYNGKSQSRMDDDWGYPHLWKPPYERYILRVYDTILYSICVLRIQTLISCDVIAYYTIQHHRGWYDKIMSSFTESIRWHVEIYRNI